MTQINTFNFFILNIFRLTNFSSLKPLFKNHSTFFDTFYQSLITNYIRRGGKCRVTIVNNLSKILELKKETRQKTRKKEKD